MSLVSQLSFKDILDRPTVYFMHNDKIYNGLLVNKEIGGTEELYQVQSPLGLSWFKCHQLYLDFNSLVKSITYEEPVRASEEFKTWAVN
jgi:hypothetical protein